MRSRDVHANRIAQIVHPANTINQAPIKYLLSLLKYADAKLKTNQNSNESPNTCLEMTAASVGDNNFANGSPNNQV